MKIKLEQRSIIGLNIIAYLLCSLTYLHILKSVHKGKSAINLEVFKLHLLEDYLIMFLAFLCMIFVAKMNKFSKALLILFIGAILGETLFILFIGFNKLIFVMTIIFIILSISFFLFWSGEMDQPIYNPLITSSDINFRPKYTLEVQVLFEKDSGQDISLKGFLSNWGPSNCFILFENDIQILTRKVSIKGSFHGINFEHEGEIITSLETGNGIGVQFYRDGNKKDTIIGWNQFYTYLTELGLIPEYIV